MKPIDWGEAWSIVFGGIIAVFFIMSLLAVLVHFMGKIFQNMEKRKKIREAAAAAGEVTK